jgi:hypothetical protein
MLQCTPTQHNNNNKKRSGDYFTTHTKQEIIKIRAKINELETKKAV